MVLGDDGGWPEFLQGLGLPTDVPFDMLEHDLDGDDGIGNDGAWWGVSYEVWEKAVAPEPTTLASSTSLPVDLCMSSTVFVERCSM